MKIFSIAIAQFTVVASLFGTTALRADAGDYDAEFTSKTKHGLYKVKTASRHDDRVRLVISRDGKTLLDKTDDHYFVLDPDLAVMKGELADGSQSALTGYILNFITAEKQKKRTK